jgi:hypothetical protein
MVTLAADGQAHLWGIHLGRGEFRKGVLWALCRTRADVRVAVHNSVNGTNIVEFFQTMQKAGWTNRQPARPNPYE